MAKQEWGIREGEEIAPGLTALRTLGGGTRFEVYLALDDRLLSTVVVKVVRPDLVDDLRTLRALRNEVRALGALAHPVIVRSFGARDDGPRPHIVLEHLEGPTLQRLLRKSPRLPVEQSIPLALHLCSALHYIAAEGWVHLDVKPSNVVMSLVPRLVDFSVARTVEKAAGITKRVGTRSYLSPEQIDPEGRGPIGPPADIWGLGLTLFEAVVGTRAFSATDDHFPQLTEEAPAFPRHTPDALVEAIEACLSRDPADRPTPAALVEILEPLVAALPTRPVLRRRRPRLG